MAPADSTPPKWSRRPPPAVANNSSWWRLLLLTGCTLALALGAYRLFSPAPAPPARVTKPATSDESWRLVTLFYPLADGSGLSSIIQKRPLCQDETACLEDLILALSDNPGAGFFPLLPVHTPPAAVWIEGATATINFRHESLQQIPGGTHSERLFLAALIDTLAVNFPQVQQLAVEIDGIPAETLKGHVDLSTPFVADFSLVRRPLLPSFPAKSGSFSERSQ